MLQSLMNRRLYEVRKSLDMTQKKMADVLGIGQNAYSQIENGKVSLTLRNRQILEEKLGISSSYLLTGDLPIFVKRAASDNLATGIEVKRGVPYITKAICSGTDHPFDYAVSDVEYYIDVEPFNECSFYRPVFGDSMLPRYNAGDIVACKRVNNKYNIIYGQTYLCLISQQGDVYETIRTLRKAENNDCVVAIAMNEAYDSVTVSFDSILELYLIYGKIERTF